MGLASSRWPKWPGHSAMFAMQVSHFIFLSIVPSLGSLKPAVFGLPASIVSLCSICTTDICLCTSNKKQENEELFQRALIPELKRNHIRLQYSRKSYQILTTASKTTARQLKISFFSLPFSSNCPSFLDDQTDEK